MNFGVRNLWKYNILAPFMIELIGLAVGKWFVSVIILNFQFTFIIKKPEFKVSPVYTNDDKVKKTDG